MTLFGYNDKTILNQEVFKPIVTGNIRDESMNFETYIASPHVKNTNKTTPAMFKSLEQPSPSDTWLQSQHNKTVILITAGGKKQQF